MNDCPACRFTLTSRENIHPPSHKLESCDKSNVGTKEQLVGAATGGGGGRGAKGRRRGPGKTELRKFKFVKLGEGKNICAFSDVSNAHLRVFS